MRAIVIFLVGIICLIGFIMVFPLVREATAILNTTSNITEYEGMWQAVQFAPLLIMFIFGTLIVFFMFRVKIRGWIPLLGKGDDDA